MIKNKTVLFINCTSQPDILTGANIISIRIILFDVIYFKNFTLTIPSLIFHEAQFSHSHLHVILAFPLISNPLGVHDVTDQIINYECHFVIL